MSEIFNYKQNQPITWFHKKLEKSNQHCLYCGDYIGINSGVKSNKEHLIARRFVPPEYFTSTDFNFIFRCCIPCNNRKSNIERHLSTTSLLSSDARLHDEIVDFLALNKANKDYHPENKGKLVINSTVKNNFDINSHEMKVNGDFFSPPQSDKSYVEELSYRHIQGLFSLMTSKNPLSTEGTSILSGKSFHIFGIYPKNDWGNSQIAYFIQKTLSWSSFWNESVARGFFKAMILGPKEEQDGWMWALEWNKSIRIIGALVKEQHLSRVYPDIPEIKWSPWIQSENGEIRTTKYKPLNGADTLFRENSE
ncbi:hypothetical protein EKO29_00410 [Colwellia sp. Arc7-635]|jgi:hypothetical protein|uniref:hypothetical protein n=1 Tax=Colwellia sp. Arc7-635 TaxID=2497879 RepID=UPI000F8594AE|nr:hypothetical protein [Colwellia sp. Arc7-635]AZQ82659.1 hypothetical protein EKO29_00410 [Colwellia sp. Arc7-635]